jgi:hypothetical protein
MTSTSTEVFENVDLQPVSDEQQGQLRSDASTQFFQYEASKRRISARLVHAIHGHLDGDGSDAASLVVLRFKMTSMNDSGDKRRWKRFYAPVRFETVPDAEPKDDPWVRAYAPGYDGTIYLTETLATNKTTKTYGLGAKLRPPPPAPLELDFNAERKKEQQSEERFLHTVESDRKKTETKGSGRGGEDIVYWNLRENSQEKVGVADELQVAILLVRPNENQNFKVQINLEGTIDFKYTVARTLDEIIHGKGACELSFDVEKGTTPPPEGVIPEELRVVMNDEDKILKSLSYIHIPEKFLPRQTYGQGTSIPFHHAAQAHLSLAGQIREGESVTAEGT